MLKEPTPVTNADVFLKLILDEVRELRQFVEKINVTTFGDNDPQYQAGLIELKEPKPEVHPCPEPGCDKEFGTKQALAAHTRAHKRGGD